MQLYYFWFIHTAAAAVADILFCPSRATAEDLHAHFRPRGRVLITPWGADHMVLRSSERALNYFRAEFGIELASESVIVTVGTLQPRKGYLHVLDALLRVRRRVIYIIFGNTGWLSESVVAGIEAFNKKAPYGSRIFWIRNAADDLIASAFSVSDLFVLASEYEGFGIPVVEAMKAGCPVAVADNSSLRELVSQEQVTFPVGDSEFLAGIIEKTLTDSVYREHQRQLSLKQADEFRWSIAAKLLIGAMSENI